MVFTCDDRTLAPNDVATAKTCRAGGLHGMRPARLNRSGYRIDHGVEGESMSKTVARGMSVCATKIAVRDDVVLRDTRDPLDIYQLGFFLGGSSCGATATTIANA